MATIERGALPSDNFTMLSNAWIRDTELSYKARGVLSWLSSHAIGFRVSLDRIAAGSKSDGVAAIRTAVKELEDAGYLVRKKDRDSNGRIVASVYTLQDPNVQVTANMQFSHDGETPSLSEPPLENTTRGEIAPLKKNISSKKNREENTSGPDLTIVPGGGDSVDGKTTRSKPRTKLSRDWRPEMEQVDQMAAELGVTRAVLWDWHTEFVDYWIGEGRTKADWLATWRNWMRRTSRDQGTRRRPADTGRNFVGKGMFS